MYNNLKDLNISYPFLPVETMPDWFRHIKYMRVSVTLPAQQPEEQTQNGDNIIATLVELGGYTSKVRVQCKTYGYDEEISVPVFTGSIPHGNSFIYTDSVLPHLTGLSYRVHPSCLMVQQEAPLLRVETYNDTTPPKMQLKYEDGDISQWLAYDIIESILDGILILNNGNNLEVSGSSDSIMFTGAVGAGTGVFAAPPYTKDSSFDAFRGKALRSINGKSGNVLISGQQSVAVTGETSVVIGVADIQ
jgi:hypothetical protein